MWAASPPAARRAAGAGAMEELFDGRPRRLPRERWLGLEVTPGWTLRDHVGHLADWMDEGARASDDHRDTCDWLSDPEEGIDAWNERHVAARRNESPDEALARYDVAHARLLD